MAGILLILRPEPGASATAERARSMGLEAVRAPLFEVKAIPWHAPPAVRFDALLMTSANAARLGGPQLRSLRELPCYAVGEATAEAARAAGWEEVRTGDGDAARLADMAAGEGAGRLLHLCGEDRRRIAEERIEITPVVVYRSDPVTALPAEARAAAETGAIALIHSPRAGAAFGTLVDEAGLDRARIMLATISEAALEAAGDGWAGGAASPLPRDGALLALAAKLCNMSAGEGTAA